MNSQHTGFCWIDPDGLIIHADTPEQLTPLLLQHEPQLTRLHNVTSTHDDAFHLSLFTHAYQRGYLRCCRYQQHLGVEAADENALSLHSRELVDMCNTLRWRGQALSPKYFLVSLMPDPLNNRERNLYFPRR